MGWWKKAISIVMIAISGYEVGKEVQQKNTEVVKYIGKSDNQEKSDTQNIKTTPWEIMCLIGAFVLIMAIYSALKSYLNRRIQRVETPAVRI